MSALIDAALSYARRGWYVVPCRKSIPCVGKGWQKISSTDEHVIRAWWDRWPNAQIGIHLEPSGLFAIDVDPRNGGDATIAAWERKYGPLPRDCNQRSGGGGEHVVMRSPDGVELRGNLGEGSGVDVKWRGVIVAAPSLHKRTNRPYEWLTSNDPPRVPDGWIEILRAPVHVQAEPDTWRESMGPLSPRDDLALRQYLLDLGARGAGNRTTLRAVVGVFHDFGLADDGRAYLDAWNDRSDKAHRHAELDRQIERCARLTFDRPRGWARGMADFEHAVVRFIERMREEREAKRKTFAIALQEARHDVEVALGWSEKVAPLPLFEPAINLFTRDYPPTPWLVRDLLTEGGTAVIATHPKSGKTWAATEIALAVATGTDAFGEFATGEPRRVAYFYAEDGAVSVRNRVRALAASRGADIGTATANLIEQTRGRYIDLCEPDSVALVVASCRQFGDIALLVIDPMRDVHSGAENDSDEMREVMRALRVIGDLLHCTVLFVHHAAKTSGEGGRGGIRGSSAIEGAVDCILTFSGQTGDGRNVFGNTVKSTVKGARSAGEFDLLLSVEDDDNGEAVRARFTVNRTSDAERADGDVEALLTVVRANPGAAWRDLEKKCVGLGSQRARNARDRAIEMGRLVEEKEAYLNKRGQQRQRDVLRVVEATS